MIWLHDICVQIKHALQQAAHLQRNHAASAHDSYQAAPLLASSASYTTAAEPRVSLHPLSSSTSSTATAVGAGVGSKSSSSISSAFPSQSSFHSAAGGLPRASSDASGTSRSGGGAAAFATGAIDKEAPSAVEVERALVAELELTKLRTRCLGAFSLLQALLDVVEVRCRCRMWMASGGFDWKSRRSS